MGLPAGYLFQEKGMDRQNKDWELILHGGRRY
jgi:hypothetical protein